MAVYVISWALSRELEHDYEFRTIQQVVKNVDSPQEAAQEVHDAYQYTDEAKIGWNLIGPPCALEVTHPRIAEWEEYVQPEPVNVLERPPYLRPVDD